MVICQRDFDGCLFRRVRPCRLWTGTRTARGYGRTSGRLVHRSELAQKLGRPIMPGFHALHHCDTPPCYEPQHLYEGTQSDNMQDALDRERGRWREHGLLRDEIRRRYLATGLTQYQLAAEFGVSQAAVSGATAGLKARRTLFVEPGQRFGRLTVVREIPGGKPRKAECLCACGKTTAQRLVDLHRGAVVSCGCHSRELVSARWREYRELRRRGA